jgi:hypothetical protein
LEKAAEALEEAFGNLHCPEDARKDLENEWKKAASSLGVVTPSRLISVLRTYIRAINLAEKLAADLETRSILELSKYLLASYVKRATGRFHDKNVSGILAAVVGPSEHNDVAQRMWRHRNYSRIDKHLSSVTQGLLAMGIVIAGRA